MEKLKEAVLKAVDEYNKYWSPEARARLIGIREDKLTIDFEGTFRPVEYTIILKTYI